MADEEPVKPFVHLHASHEMNDTELEDMDVWLPEDDPEEDADEETEDQHDEEAEEDEEDDADDDDEGS